MKKKRNVVPVLQPRFRVRSGEDIALGPGKVELLELVEQTGSLVQAAKQMGMSYMRAWTLVRTANRCFKKPLVVLTRGGSSGGGAALTEDGRRACMLYRQLERAGIRAASPHWRQLQKLLRG